MHAISIFLLVVGGLLVTSFSSHATQDMADMTAGSSSMPEANVKCGTGRNLSILSHTNGFNGLKKQVFE